MPEPLTLAVVGATVVTEGIKFLYGQAAEAIKRWRESRNTASASKTAPAQATPPAIFAGELAPLEFHLANVGALEKDLLSLRAALTDYVDGLEVLAPDDHVVLEAVDALRQSMEAIYQQRLTFIGEQRAPSGPVVEGTIDVKTIAGTVAGVKARLIESGKVVGSVVSDKVESGAVAVGVKVDTIGRRR